MLEMMLLLFTLFGKSETVFPRNKPPVVVLTYPNRQPELPTPDAVVTYPGNGN